MKPVPLVILIVLLDWAGLGMVYPMFSSMLFSAEGQLFDLNLTPSLKGLILGILLAAMPIAQFFSAPILGSYSDIKGRKPILIISLMIIILGYILSGIGASIKSITTLIISRVLVGIGAGNSAVVSATLSDLSSKELKTKYFGYYSMASGVGFTIGPLLGGELSMIDFSLPFWIAALANAISLLLMVFFKETKSLSVSEIKPSTMSGIRQCIEAFSYKHLRFIFLANFIYCFGWSYYYEFLPVIWIHDLGLNSHKIGLFFAYGALWFALGSGVIVQPMTRAIGNKAVIIVSFLLQATAIALSILFTSESAVWIYFPLINCLSSLCFPSLMALVSDRVEANIQGEILGIHTSIQSAAFAISPLAAGTLLGSYLYMPILIGAITMFGAAILILPVKK
jgi:DHA1 family tetracycline resistance protein-like MFS transporter